MLSEQTINMLNDLPLTEVMRNNGFSPDRRTASCVFYRCPFHKERNASFCVDRFPKKGQAHAGFNCFVCGETAGTKGFGAIMLQQKLLERLKEKSDFTAAVSRLAKDFNLIIEGDYKNGFFHRMKRVDAQTELGFELKEGAFSNAELRALGCQSYPVYRREYGSDGEETEVTERGEDGNAVYRYSFGKDFYSSACKGNNFDSRVLHERFNLYALESYTTPARVGEGGTMYSYRVSSTPSYPVFLFLYKDEKGWWARKYEPYFRETSDKDGRRSPNHKFTWWYEGDRRREDLKGMVYGDSDVMRALRTGEVESSDGDGHPTVMVERKAVSGGKTRKNDVKVFRRIVICSGPRDAISVYFHSDAHVVFPHSECVEIPRATMEKLFEIAASVYVLYDMDRTGIRQMNALALKYVELKVIYLPEDLRTQTNPRTGNPCKDAEEFFSFYPAVMRRHEQLSGVSINHYFNDLLVTAKRMRFWDIQFQNKRDEDDEKFKIPKYTLNFDCMSQFLSANGFYRYIDESGSIKFVHVRNNIVDVVDESQALSVAKEIMKDFLRYNSRYYTEDLSNAVSTQKKVGKDTMSNIRSIRLNFVSWGKDFEYFFFRNCAVRVTKDSIEQVDYINLPFHVNRDAILDWDYRPERTPLFEICENPDYAAERERHEQRMADKRMSEEDILKETARFTAYQRLYRFRLRFPKDLKDMPPCIQYLYDISRIHWRKEQVGMALTEEERQRQDMHFVNKAAALGYVLSRYRTGTMQQLAAFTDYSVVDEGKSSGGTGKSLLRDFLELVRKVRYISGKGFKKKENMAKNFQEFHDTVDSLFFIDDLREDIGSDEFYNVTENITVKTLYNNEVTLPKERTPKIFVTMNKMSFDLNEDSTARRVFLCMVSDYYHPGNYSGTVRPCSPYTKFGKDIIKEATEEERNASIQMMLQCCQFYLGLQEVIVPPMERDGLMRIIYSSIKDAVFIEWANRYFSSPLHFSRPLSLQEIAMDWLEHRGEEITGTNIRRNRADLVKKLKLYCLNMQYVMNPPVVFRSDQSSEYPRHTAWETEFEHDRPTGRPRIRKSTRCCFFYRIGEEPRSVDMIQKCPETDLEMEERKKEEEEGQ